METINTPQISVLIADDETLLRRLIRHKLKDEGFDPVWEARDGREAVELACQHRPDAIVMDLRMPGLDGIEASTRIKAMLPTTPIIVVTSFPELKLLATDSGAVDAYFDKCVIATELVDELRRLVAKARDGSWGRKSETAAPEDSPAARWLGIKAAAARLQDAVRAPLPECAAEQQPSASAPGHAEVSPSPDLIGSTVGGDTGLLLSALLHDLTSHVVAARRRLRAARRSQDIPAELERVETHTRRAVEVMQQIQAPLLTLDVAPVDLRPVITTAEEQVQVPEGVSFSADIPDQTAWVMGNERALVTVLGNLLRNAALACQSGGVITLAARRAGEEWVELDFRDNGCGIESAEQARLFNPFFTTRKEEGGQGLGLWLARRLVERLGGEMELLWSAPGEGTAFRIRLPAAPAEAAGDREG
jgi:CheY-like chemotaxis protein/two-component sensor histidine kinase